MKIKQSLTLFTLFTFYTLLSSHEFWLSPDKFIYKRGEKINIRFLTGENFEGENWKGNNKKIKSLRLYFGGISDDLSKFISEEKGDSLELMMLDEGINVVAFNSTNSFIELGAQKFNDYLKENGLAEIVEYRNQNNEKDSIGRELYQRCAKTIFQVGKATDKTFSVSTELPLDIIPLSSPYQLKNGDSLRLKIFFQDTPLTNTLITIWHRSGGSTNKSELVSDKDGEINFPVVKSGKWMISVVKMIQLQNDPKADWQSYRGTLTWGYE